MIAAIVAAALVPVYNADTGRFAWVPSAPPVPVVRYEQPVYRYATPRIRYPDPAPQPKPSPVTMAETSRGTVVLVQPKGVRPAYGASVPRPVVPYGKSGR